MKNNITTYGILAGILMAAIMALFSINGDYSVGFVKYLKYVALFAVLIMVDLLIKKRFANGNFFQKGLVSGLRLSIYAGAIVAASALLLFAVNPAFAPMKFNLIPETWLDAVTISVMLLIEVVALGFILNFIVLQSLKTGPKPLNE